MPESRTPELTHGLRRWLRRSSPAANRDRGHFRVDHFASVGRRRAFSPCWRPSLAAATYLLFEALPFLCGWGPRKADDGRMLPWPGLTHTRQLQRRRPSDPTRPAQPRSTYAVFQGPGTKRAPHRTMESRKGCLIGTVGRRKEALRDAGRARPVWVPKGLSPGVRFLISTQRRHLTRGTPGQVAAN